MKIFMILLFSLAAMFSFAQEEEQKVHVHALDESVDLTPLNRPEYKKYQGVGEFKSASDTLPSPKKLDELFKQAGMSEDVKEMDQLDKDLLYKKIVRRSVEDVANSYPQISKEKLYKLKALVGGK